MARYRQVPEAGVAAARDLRRRLTTAERVLWAALRQRQLGGLRFRRQHPVGPYFLDFFCPAGGLVIELDGAVHEATREYDEERTRYLAAYGYRVIRFKNEEVLRNLASVLAQIEQAALTASTRSTGEEEQR
ncbi:MAG: endonuclease domain-containing protein [Thermomicrobiales bacterium]